MIGDVTMRKCLGLPSPSPGAWRVSPSDAKPMVSPPFGLLAY